MSSSSALTNRYSTRSDCLSLFMSLSAVPCVPSGVVIMLNCASQEAAVYWNASQGALSYAVTAVSALGDKSACVSTGPGCTLTNLTCGHSYRVQVLALDNICSSLPSGAVMFSTGSASGRRRHGDV